MANGALWDVGLWDQDKWDTIALTSGWTENPDSWTSSLVVTNYLTGDINENSDVWVSSVQVTNTLSANILESLDIWTATIHLEPPGTSLVQENPDIWSALLYVTLHPPIYGAGGGWGWTWYSDRPEYNSKEDVNRAYEKWRYTVDASVSERGDQWSVRADTYEMEPERIRAKVIQMFGSSTFIDWEEEAIIEELLR